VSVAPFATVLVALVVAYLRHAMRRATSLGRGTSSPRAGLTKSSES
jgi:hypothetical protein